MRVDIESLKRVKTYKQLENLRLKKYVNVYHEASGHQSSNSETSSGSNTTLVEAEMAYLHLRTVADYEFMRDHFAKLKYDVENLISPESHLPYCKIVSLGPLTPPTPEQLYTSRVPNTIISILINYYDYWKEPYWSEVQMIKGMNKRNATIGHFLESMKDKENILQWEVFSFLK